MATDAASDKLRNMVEALLAMLHTTIFMVKEIERMSDTLPTTPEDAEQTITPREEPSDPATEADADAAEAEDEPVEEETIIPTDETAPDALPD